MVPLLLAGPPDADSVNPADDELERADTLAAVASAVAHDVGVDRAAKVGVTLHWTRYREMRKVCSHGWLGGDSWMRSDVDDLSASSTTGTMPHEPRDSTAVALLELDWELKLLSWADGRTPTVHTPTSTPDAAVPYGADETLSKVRTRVKGVVQLTE